MISASWQIRIEKPPEEFHFVPAGEGSSTVSCDVDLTFKGAMKLLAPLTAGKVRKSIETERGPALKAALETPAV